MGTLLLNEAADAIKDVASHRRFTLIKQSRSDIPRRESGRHVWPVKEDDTQSNDIDFYKTAFENSPRRWGLSENHS